MEACKAVPFPTIIAIEDTFSELEQSSSSFLYILQVTKVGDFEFEENRFFLTKCILIEEPLMS
jgi:hypothetical protein